GGACTGTVGPACTVGMDRVKEVTASYLFILSASDWIYADGSANNGTIGVGWMASSTSGVTYILEESTSAAFTTSTQVYSGSATTANLPGHGSGTYYYRVKVTKAGYIDSSWRAVPSGCVVSVALPASGWIYADGSANNGTIGVGWMASSTSGVTYILEESTSAAFTTSTQVYSGSATTANLPGHGSGTYYYRVRLDGIFDFGSNLHPRRVHFRYIHHFNSGLQWQRYHRQSAWSWLRYLLLSGQGNQGRLHRQQLACHTQWLRGVSCSSCIRLDLCGWQCQ